MEQIKINWTKKAESSLERIHNYISLDSIVYADRFIEALIMDTTNFFQIGIAKGRLVQEFENTPISFLREIIY